MLYIGSDHGGYKLKEELKAYLNKKKIDYADLGPDKLDPKDDYPKFAEKVAQAVSKNPRKNLGVLLCRSGQGVCIAANKVKGVRAALSWNEAVAKASRVDDNANILCLPSDYISTEAAEDILKMWLKSDFSNGDRHVRRLKEIDKIMDKQLNKSA